MGARWLFVDPGLSFVGGGAHLHAVHIIGRLFVGWVVVCGWSGVVLCIV